MSEKVLLKGNEAFGEAAIRYGCRYYFGYPITPQNEMTEYMAANLPKAGGSFVQAESELAAVNMAYGASVAGGRAMISSSSPGIALMQEGFSFMASAEVPCVVLNVSRGGPGIGSIQPGQADYFQATRGGGNGDYRLIVLAPSSIQEATEIIGRAFDLADQWRNPVLVLADGVLGQMMEPVVLPEPIPALDEADIEKVKPWALTGHKGTRPHNVIRSLHLIPETLEAYNQKLQKKYGEIQQSLTEYEAFGLEDAEFVFVAYGSTARIVREAIELLAEEGIRAGLIRPITLWPYPYHAFDQLGDSVKQVISVELSCGQMIDDVKIGVNGRFPVGFLGRSGGNLITPPEIVAAVKEKAAATAGKGGNS